jgi:hypothetical protein
MSRSPELRTHKRAIEDRRAAGGFVPPRVATHPRPRQRRERADERAQRTPEQTRDLHEWLVNLGIRREGQS